MLASLGFKTLDVEMVNCAEFVPELTVTLAGTFTNGASPASVMTAPPVGAAALKVTVPVTLEPPVTEFAESVSPETVWLKAAGANCSKVSMSRQSAKIGERKCREGRAEKAGQRTKHRWTPSSECADTKCERRSYVRHFRLPRQQQRYFCQK